MGMVLCLKTASDEDIALLLSRPRLILPFLHGEPREGGDMRAPTSSGSAAPRTLWGKIARLLGRATPPEVPPTPPRPDFGLGEEETEIDKSWHAIHWLLTGKSEGGEMPLALLLEGGRSVGDIEVGWGAARALTSTETSAFHRAIAPIDVPLLRSRFDGKRMDAANIYPAPWEGDGIEIFDEYLAPNYEVLKEFLAKAVAAKKGLIVWFG